MARYMRGYGQYKLGEPQGGPGIAWHGPGTYLVYPRPAFLTRQARYKLSPPAVVAAPPVFTGPKVWQVTKRNVIDYGTRRAPIAFIEEPIIPPLAEPTRVTLAYSRRGQPKSLLRVPTDTVGLEDQGQIQTWIAYSRRGAPKSRLLPPTVVIPAPVQFGPQVALAPSTRPITKSALRQPAVVGAGVVNPGLRIRLTFGRAQRGVAALFPPTDTVGPEDQGRVLVRLSPSRRPITKSVLRPPTDTVGLEDQGHVFVHLARIKPPPTLSVLRPPAVVGAGVVNPGLRIKLVFGKRGVPRSRLFAPTVVTSTQFFYGPAVHVTRIRPRRVLSRLRLPTDTIGIEDQGRVVTHLAYSRRGRPIYRLRPPTDTVGLEDQGQVYEWLTYSRRGTAKYVLRRPTVVDVAVAALFGPEIHLARINPVPTLALLRSPAVIGAGVVNPGLRIKLVFGKRGVPKSVLRAPVVVGAGVVNPGLRIKLAFGRRPITKSRLRPSLAPAGPPVSFGPEVHLTYSRRPKPLSGLGKPTIVDLLAPLGGILISLAPSFRGRPKSFIKPPTKVFTFIARTTQVFLAPQSRGVPRYDLKPPTVLKSSGLLQVNLTYSRRGKPRSALKLPTVVFQAVEIYGPEQWLTYSRRGRPQSRLSLTAIVRRAPFRAIAVHLTRIKPPPVLSVLKPPSVIGGGIAFYGPLTTLVRIRPQRVHSKLKQVLVRFRRPHGDICGFDIASSFVCSLEVPGSQVTGGTATRFGISGSSRAGSKVSGSEQAGGSASGSDRKAT